MRRPFSVCSDGSIRAVRSTICWVRPSSRLGALITRSRSCSNASLWASSSRSALAAATTTRVSRSRRCCCGSGTASSRIWRTLNACESVVFALATARLNGSVWAVPNSSTASANSASLVRTALSTSTTMDFDRSSSASIGTDASALASVGSTRLAAAASASRRLRRRRRIHSHNSSTARTRTASAISSPSPDTAGAGGGRRRVEPVGRRHRGTGPVVVAQCRFDFVAADVVRQCRGAAGDRGRDIEPESPVLVAIASSASSLPRSLAFMVFWAQLSPLWPEKSLT